MQLVNNWTTCLKLLTDSDQPEIKLKFTDISPMPLISNKCYRNIYISIKRDQMQCYQTNIHTKIYIETFNNSNSLKIVFYSLLRLISREPWIPMSISLKNRSRFSSKSWVLANTSVISSTYVELYLCRTARASSYLSFVFSTSLRHLSTRSCSFFACR